MKEWKIVQKESNHYSILAENGTTQQWLLVRVSRRHEHRIEFDGSLNSKMVSMNRLQLSDELEQNKKFNHEKNSMLLVGIKLNQIQLNELVVYCYYCCFPLSLSSISWW